MFRSGTGFISRRKLGLRQRRKNRPERRNLPFVLHTLLF